MLVDGALTRGLQVQHFDKRMAYLKFKDQMAAQGYQKLPEQKK